MLARLAAWCYRRRWRVLIAWLVLLVGVSVLSQTVGGDLLKTFSLPGTQSQSAFDVLKKDFARAGDAGDLVYRVKGAGTINDPAVREQINHVVGELKALKNNHIVSVTTPYDQGGARFVSQRSGQKIAYAEILFDVQSNDVPIDLANKMRSLVEKADTSQLQVELGGAMFTDQSQPAS